MLMIVLPANKKDLQKNPRSVISVIFNVALMPDLTVHWKQDQKHNINLVKISKKLTIFHKSRENIDEADSNTQVQNEIFCKKNSKKTLFQSEKARALPVLQGNENFLDFIKQNNIPKKLLLH